MNTESLFRIWRNMTRSHEFDEQVYKAVEQKRVTCFVYLSSGQESIAASVAEAFRGYKPNIFCQHRSHSAYISFGGDLVKLRDELLVGHGGDPMIDDRTINFFGHSGLVADQVPIAVGYAYATRQPVVCFIGDSTVEEDVFWSSFGVAVTHNLPILFVCENNGLSVVTRVEKRRSWEATDIANAFGANTLLSMDNPADIYAAVRCFAKEPNPTFADLQCCRKYRHVGIGIDSEMAWDAYALMRSHVAAIDADRATRIENDSRKEMAELWIV